MQNLWIVLRQFFLIVKEIVQGNATIQINEGENDFDELLAQLPDFICIRIKMFIEQVVEVDVVKSGDITYITKPGTFGSNTIHK